MRIRDVAQLSMNVCIYDVCVCVVGSFHCLHVASEYQNTELAMISTKAFRAWCR